MSFDRLKDALVDGFTNPQATIPPFWFDVLVLVIGVVIGSGVFGPGQ